MTQLDSVTWLPQIIWLFIIFFGLYSYVQTFIGPTLCKGQKIRSKIINKHYSSTVFYNYLNVEVMFKRSATISSNFN